MKFSIITVCYNSEKTIAATLESVDKQSFSDYEHIIIDGLSNDKTIEICRHTINNNRQIISEIDEGIFDAMNKGLSISSGEYLIFLNSDDRFYDNDILSIIDKSLKDECIIYGNILISKDKKIHRKWISNNFTMKNLNLVGCPHTGTFIKRSLIEKNNINYDLKYKISADYDYLIRSFKASKKTKYINYFITDMQHGGNSNASLASSIKKNMKITV